MTPKKLFCFFSVAMLCAVNIALAQKNMTLQSNLPYPSGVLSNIGGYVDTVGNEYALVGYEYGLSIVNVQDPTNPVIVKNIPGPQSIWREVKVWQKYAYVTTEGGNQGLQIIDLSNLPDTNSIPYHNWAPNITANGNNYTLSTIHALHIDNAFVYLYGANNGTGIDGIVIGDLADPWNPTVSGIYDGYYVHDGYVRNDTVWACHIYDGFFSAIDVSDKANPIALASNTTPRNFTHNSWLSDNSRYLFTTDEVDNSYLAAYDVSDVNNIQAMDKTFSQNPGGNSIVHNTHILNDFAVTSWYKDGVVITDVHRPENLVNVGWYDTSPFAGGGFSGCWGVYPFLPSGNLVASDIEGGLFVISPTYVRACYLEGNISDSICGQPINGVKITVVAANILDSTDIVGDYKTGTPDAGIYDVIFEKAGYITKTITGVQLTNAIVTNLNVTLNSNLSVSLNGNVVVAGGGSGIADANVTISNSNYAYNFSTDAAGDFTQCALIAGNYDIIAAKWGYKTYCINQAISNANLTIDLETGIYDDFTFSNNWAASGSSTVGLWTRVVPVETLSGTTPSNPGVDATNDCGNKAYVTGNNGASVGQDDVDDGNSILTSPVFDLTSFVNPHIQYARWFYNGGGSSAGNDSLIISITNGTQTAVIERISVNTPGLSTWVEKNILLQNTAIPYTSSMQLIITATDYNPGHLVEAGFDHFRVDEGAPDAIESLNSKIYKTALYPNPANENINLNYVFEGNNTTKNIQIIDFTGKIVEQIAITNNNGSINLQKKLTAGIYYVRFIADGRDAVTSKLIIYK